MSVTELKQFYSFFLDGVRKHGLQHRARGDGGGENVAVARFILEHPLRGVYIWEKRAQSTN